MGVEATALVEELKSTWGLMKGAMDDMRTEVKTVGSASSESSAKVEKMEKRMVELETKLNRPILAGSGEVDAGNPKAVEAKAKKDMYFKILRGNGLGNLEPEEREQARKWGLGPVGARELKALALGDDTTGGFLAPPEYVQDIIKGVQLISPIRQVANVRSTSRRSIHYPVRSGVFAAQWIGETAVRSETTGLAYSMEEITTQEMYAEVLVSEQDLEDTVFDLEAEIRDNAAEQFAKAEGAAFVSGDGIKKPEGFMTAAGISIDLSGAAGTIASAAAGSAGQGNGLIAHAYALKSAYVQGAVFLMNRQTVGVVRKLADSQGRYLWEPNFQVATNSGYQGASGSSLLGIPIVETPDLLSEGASNFPIVLGNFKRGYLILDRVEMVVKRLNEKYAEQGQIAFIVRKRVGGQVILPEAIRKYKSNNS